MRFLFRLLRWTRADRDADALSEELDAHRAMLQDEYERRGLAPDDAAALSRRAMGNMTLARDEARDVWTIRWLDVFWRNLRYGARGLRRDPSFALATTLTLALGVATITTVFSVVDGEIWKPLPFSRPDRLVAVASRGPGAGARVDAVSLATLAAWRAGAPALSDLSATGDTTRRVLRRETAESVLVMTVTSNYFDTLRQPATLGRTFHPDDARGSRGVVMTDRAWRRLFDADPAVPGRTLVLDDASFTAIGVVPDDDPFAAGVDFFVPLDGSPSSPEFTRPAVFGGIGRLADGATAPVARAQLQAVAERLARDAPAGGPAHTMFVEEAREYYTVSDRRPFYFFLGAALLVLLLGEVNAATLLLARAFRRTREFALRGALGGGREALAGQLLTEAALLAAPAGALGLALTFWSARLLAPLLPPDLFLRGTNIAVDLRVAGFALAVTGLTSAAFVVAPLALSRRLDLAGALGPGTRESGSAVERRARWMLLSAQIALALVLLSGAGLFLKSFAALTRVPLGFDPANALALRATLSGPRYATGQAILAYADDLVARARSVPGVVAAAIDTSSPLGSGPLVYLADPRQPDQPVGDAPRAIIRAVDSSYFRTLDVAIVRGRPFSPADAGGAPRVGIVNATLATRLFGADNPIGRTVTIRPARNPPWIQPGTIEIVGVAANVKEVGLNEVDFPDLYVPFRQSPAPSVELVVRTAVPPASIADSLRHGAALVDPAIPVTSVRTFDERVASALQGDRFNLVLIGAFAGAALLVAAVGIYGTVTYSTEARAREFGVRLALGAHPWRLVMSALGRAVRVASIGGLAGLAIVLLLAGVIGDGMYLVPGSHNGLLYHVRLTDPAMLAAAFAGIVVVALVASLVPALRIARVDPVGALRHD